MNVCVVGLGKIGIPLAVQFAASGARVSGYDIDAKRCDAINGGRSPLSHEPGIDERLGSLVRAGALVATTDAREAVSGSEVVILIVPVDIDAQQKPDFGMLDDAVSAIAPHLTKGALVIVETTVPVGTTRHRVAGRLSAISGLAPGTDFAIAFSPERVSSGSVLLDLQRYPKIVGGIDEASTHRAADFYREMLAADVLPMHDAETAEYSKLLETTYRDVNIALANEFAKAGDAMGVDTRAAIEAANTQPYSRIHAPGPGVGGHCIPVYPYFIGSPQMPNAVPRSDLITAARKINDGMSAYCIARLEDAIGTLNGARIIVLGLSYRAGVKEARHSSTFGLVSALDRIGAAVSVHDPLFDDVEVRSMGLVPTSAFPTPCDALVVQAWHAEYRDLDFASLLGLRAVLDTRANLDRSAVEGAGVRYLAPGVA